MKTLGKSNSDDAIKTVVTALQGEDIYLAIGPILDSKNPKVHKLVLGEVRNQYDHLLSGKVKDKAALGKQVTRMLTLLTCLRGRDDEATDQFLTHAFVNREKLAAIKSEPSGVDIVNRLATIIALGPPNAQAALIDAHATLSDELLMESFTAAYFSRDASDVFEMFGPYFSGKGSSKKSKRAAIVNAIGRQSRLYGAQQGDVDEGAAEMIDPRWLDLAVTDGDLEFVLTLARPGHAGSNQFLRRQLSEKLKKSKDYHLAGRILQSMVHMLHPDATDATIELISAYAKSSQSSYYWIAPLIEQLPKEAAPKLEALLPGLPDKVVDQLLDHITELKNKPS